MKKWMLLITCCYVFATACQKSLTETRANNPTDTIPINNGIDTTFPGNYEDTSIIRAGDKVTYEVITSDTTGWYGVWNDSTGKLVSNGLDQVSYGGPNAMPSGWKYSFICPNRPFQALISAVVASDWQKRTLVRLYKNDRLIKACSDNVLPAAARLIANAETDSLAGTNSHPVLTYEVFTTNTDSSYFQYNAWLGQWVGTADGKSNDYYDPLLSELAMPSGWRYSFYPDALPFTMSLGAWRQVNNFPGTVIINFYKNGQLVKTRETGTPSYAADYSYTVY